MSNPFPPSKGRGWKKCNNAHRQEAPRSIDGGNVTFGHRLIYSRRSRHHKFESRDEWLGIRSKR